MANPKKDPTDGAPPRNVHVEEKKTNWLAWLALVAGILALLIFLGRGDREPDADVVETTENDVVDTADNMAAVPDADVVSTPAIAGTAALGSYLAGTEALPRTFVFERLNFDTAKSDIRTENRDELTSITAALKQHPNARIRIIGYADARGDKAVNAILGKTRADSVKAALVADGIAATRVETQSGGETDPIDTNATSAGQAENRRTELVVLQR